MTSDEALEAVEEEGLGGRRDKKQFGSRYGIMFFRRSFFIFIVLSLLLLLLSVVLVLSLMTMVMVMVMVLLQVSIQKWTKGTGTAEPFSR